MMRLLVVLVGMSLFLVACDSSTGSEAPSPTPAVTPSSSAAGIPPAPPAGPAPTPAVAVLPPIADTEFVANANPDTEEPAGGQAGWLADLDFSTHDAFDRVVLRFSPPVDDGATVGWDARWVDAYVPVGEEDPPALAGGAVLQVTLRAVSLPFDDLDRAFPVGRFPGPGEAILDLANVGWFEGQHDLVIGAPSRRPFRVYADHPQRVIVEVAR